MSFGLHKTLYWTVHQRFMVPLLVGEKTLDFYPCDEPDKEPIPVGNPVMLATKEDGMFATAMIGETYEVELLIGKSNMAVMLVGHVLREQVLDEFARRHGYFSMADMHAEMLRAHGVKRLAGRSVKLVDVTCQGK